MGLSFAENRLVAVCDDVWRVESRVALGPGFWLPVASTVLRASDGTLTVISPTRFDDATAAALEALGPVARLVAPNRFHHVALPAAMARWPAAAVYGAPGLSRKRRDIAFAQELSTGSDVVPEVDVHVVAGAPMAGECALYHRPSRSLILTDLCSHVLEEPSWLGRAYLRWSRALGVPGQTALWRFLARDKAAACQSAAHLVSLALARVLPSHGAPMDADAKAQLRAALRWTPPAEPHSGRAPAGAGVQEGGGRPATDPAARRHR